MAQTAAHLVVHVMPPVPVRQWVISVPKRLRWFLGERSAAVAALTRIFMSEVGRLVREAAGVASLPAADHVHEAGTGAVSFLHRFGSALNRHVHLHVCVTDGVFYRTATGDQAEAGVAFLPSRPITPGDLDSLTVRGKSPPWPFSIRPTDGKAEVFHGRQSPHRAAADFFHSLLTEHVRRRLIRWFKRVVRPTDPFQPAPPASAGRLPGRRHRAHRVPSPAATGPPSFPRRLAGTVASRSPPSSCAMIDSRKQIRPARLRKQRQHGVHWTWRRLVSGGGGRDCRINHAGRSTPDHKGTRMNEWVAFGIVDARARDHRVHVAGSLSHHSSHLRLRVRTGCRQDGQRWAGSEGQAGTQEGCSEDQGRCRFSSRREEEWPIRRPLRRQETGE